MASTFKTFKALDVDSNRDMLHEAIPVTGSIVSGTYGDNNIKNYSHGLFQSVYDYPYLSSSANHIFDITTGYSRDSALSGSGVQNAKKINIYNEMAQILVGFDETGSVRRFDRDGNLAGGDKLDECIFVNFARLLTKDEIKKQSFSMTVYTSGSVTGGADAQESTTLQDHGALTAYKTNSPAGEYAMLYTSSAATNGSSAMGLIYYQAGIAVLTASLFSASNVVAGYFGNPQHSQSTIAAALTGSSISGAADGLRNRLQNISFNNTTEINSTIYWCRANNNEFNYSSNPTYLSASQIVVKNNAGDNPRSFITSVGLYSADGELLATAKLSEPLQKDPTDSITVRVRLDY